MRKPSSQSPTRSTSRPLAEASAEPLTAPSRRDWWLAALATLIVALLALEALGRGGALAPQPSAALPRSPEEGRNLVSSLVRELPLAQTRWLATTWSRNERARGRIAVRVELQSEHARAGGGAAFRDDVRMILDALVQDARLGEVEVFGIRILPPAASAGSAAQPDLELLVPRQAFARFPWSRATGDDVWQLVREWGTLVEARR